MYISEVSGHRSATLAIEKAIKQLRPDTDILSINAFTSGSFTFASVNACVPVSPRRRAFATQ